MGQEKDYSGLRKALRAIDIKHGGENPDAIDRLAKCCGVLRTTVLNWLHADHAVFKAGPHNRVREVVQQAGGPADLARALGVTHQAVSEWVKLGYVPPKRAQEIELQYGVPRAELVSPRVRSVMGIGGDL